MTYPTSPVFNSLNFKSQFYNVRSTSISGRTQVRHLGGHRWTWTAAYPNMKRATFQPVYAYINSQNASTFTIVLPKVCSKSGDATGSAKTNASCAIGATTIPVDDFTGTLKAGDLIKFSNHTKVYMITADRNGAGDLSITPGLRVAVPNNRVITYDDVPITARLNSDVQEYSFGVDDVVKFEVDMVEVV